MARSIRTFGDKEGALRCIPEAERLLYLLKSGNINKLPCVWDNRYLADGSLVRVSSIFGNDYISITSPIVVVVSEEIVFANLYVAELSTLNTPPTNVYLPQVQMYDNGDKYVSDFVCNIPIPTDVTYLFSQYDIALGDYAYVSNWWTGYVEKYNLKGKLISFHNARALAGHPSGGRANQQIAVGNDKIAMVSNILSNYVSVFVFDLDFNYLYNIPRPETSTGAGGICINSNMMYVAWNQQFVDGHTTINRYNLNDGSYIDTLEIDTTVGIVFEALDFYDGKLYATDVMKKQVIVYAPLNIVKKLKFSTLQTSFGYTPMYYQALKYWVGFFNTSLINGVSFLWNFGDSTTSVEENPFHGYDVDQTYIVTLMVTDSEGKQTVATKNVGSYLPINPDEPEPRGIAVSGKGIFISGFYYRQSLASYPTYAPTENVYIYHYDLNFNFIRKIGSYGFGKNQFHRPFGLDLLHTEVRL